MGLQWCQHNSWVLLQNTFSVLSKICFLFHKSLLLRDVSVWWRRGVAHTWLGWGAVLGRYWLSCCHHLSINHHLVFMKALSNASNLARAARNIVSHIPHVEDDSKNGCYLHQHPQAQDDNIGSAVDFLDSSCLQGLIWGGSYNDHHQSHDSKHDGDDEDECAGPEAARGRWTEDGWHPVLGVVVMGGSRGRSVHLVPHGGGAVRSLVAGIRNSRKQNSTTSYTDCFRQCTFL